MTVELVAARLIARHVGSSIYTWTSVIGVVLAGIAAGNWMGGRLADRYRPASALGALFAVASLAAFSIPALNRAVGGWAFLWKQEWPVRIAAHVFMVFFIPSLSLGCIGPVAAKMALDLGRQAGRTVGNVYAWGAVGSIVGTFLTGFVLIAKMGTLAVLLSVGCALALVGLLFGARSLFPLLWAGLALALVWITMGPWQKGRQLGTRLGFFWERYSTVLHLDESQYSFIQIEQEAEPPSMRALSLDHLIHAYIVMDSPDDLQYDYEKIYDSVTKTAARDRTRFAALFIGGGGFVFPRYILSKWPGSYVEIAEIDPRVTEAAHRAFGLARDAPLRIANLDGRNHVDDLLRRKLSADPPPLYDFIYGDAFNHYAVPHHLTTVEFNDKLRRLLSPSGVYMMNILEVYDSGKFLGAIINTFRKTFPHVYVFCTEETGPAEGSNRRDTYVVVGALRPLEGRALLAGVPGSALTPQHVEFLVRQARGIVLTDDYAPVEQLLEPVIRLADKEG